MNAREVWKFDQRWFGRYLWYRTDDAGRTFEHEMKVAEFWPSRITAEQGPELFPNCRGVIVPKAHAAQDVAP